MALSGIALLLLLHAGPPGVTIEIEDEDTPAPATPPSRSAAPPSATPPSTTPPRPTGPPPSAPPSTAPPPSTTPPPSSGVRPVDRSPPVPEAISEPAAPPTTAPPSQPAPASPPIAPVQAPIPVAAPASPQPSVVAPDDDVRAELAALRARVAALESEKQSAQDRRQGPAIRTAGPRPDLPPISVGFGPSMGVAQWGVRISGYIQTQYQHSQLSQDQIQQGGILLNRDRFSIRRGRVRLSGDWKHFAFDFELDGSTTRGPFIGVRQASVSVLYRNPDAARPPYLMVTAGLTETPFGHEMRLGQRDTLFMERSLGSLSFFPGPVDVGLRVRGGLGAFRYDLAVLNGTPLDDRAGARAIVDATRAPDYAGRLGFEVRPKRLAVGGGVSFLHGTGFHRGADATKGRVEWSDLNENGVLDSGELVAIPGMAATPSQNFRRWAVGADLQLAIRSKAGWSQLLVEATMASNLDRDLIVADPVVTGADVRELQAYAAYLQELFRWSVIGARYDYYDPNSDLLDRRRGIFVPANAAIHTVSPLVGAVLPTGVVPGFRARLVFQYDAIVDALGRDARGVPANLRNDQLTVRLQGEF